MADSVGEAPEGVHLKSQDIELQASQHSVDEAVATFSRLYRFTLEWIHKNPVQFSGILLLIAWWIYQRRLGKVEIAAMKNQYSGRRTLIQEQLNLPLQLVKRSDSESEDKHNG